MRQGVTMVSVPLHVGARRFPRDPTTGRKIFFYPSVEGVDPAIIACAATQTLY